MKREKFNPNTPSYQTFLTKLRLARQEANCSQRELARRLNIHWSRVIRSENGERPLSIIEVRAICEALQISVVDFTTELEVSLTTIEADAPGLNATDGESEDANTDPEE